MADFRKWFLAFVLVALLLGTGTAYADSAFTCVANAGAPVIVRVEGITELIGDLLLQCTGGNPTPLGQPVNTSDIRLTLNTNITSRLLAGSGFADALLLIDEPYPNDSNTPQNTHPGPGDANTGQPGFGVPTVPNNSPFQVLCAPRTSPSNGVGPSTPASCNYLKGTFSNPTVSGAYGQPNSPYLQANQTAQNAFAGEYSASTIYEARQFSASAVEWDGVPIDPPGSTGVRIIRMTNVRANACQLGLSSTLIPTQIVGFVAVTGGQFFTINNPQQTLAYINGGLVVSGNNTQLQQCNNLNTGGGGIGGNFFAGSGTGIAVTNVNVREGFAQSFKRQAFTPDTTISGIGIAAGSSFSSTGSFGSIFFYNTAPQNVPGLAYNTESGFQPTLPNGTTQLDPRLGSAVFGTRILLRFSNIGIGARLIVPGVVPLTIDNSTTPANPEPPSNVGGWSGGYLVLLGTSDLNGNVGSLVNQFNPVNNFSNSSFFLNSPFKGPGAVFPFNTAFETTVTAGSAAVVYEVVNSDPAAIEQANIPIGVAFISNTAQNIPAIGQAFVNTSFAPTSTDQTASATDFIPRFCDQSSPRGTFNIGVCQCNLLFPFVTQAPGFDTGIAIANTTSDPYGTTPQTGPVAMYFYGQTTGGGSLGALGVQKTTGNVPPGQVLTYTTFGGAGAFAAGLQPVPGFTGYMIAIANFQYCHGFAFISDLGAQKLAEGYLAIQLDIYNGSGLNRTGITGEVQGH